MYSKTLNILLIAGYVCELVFVCILVLKFAPVNYQALSEKMNRNATVYRIYWGSAFIIILANLIFLFIKLNVSNSIFFLILYSNFLYDTSPYAHAYLSIAAVPVISIAVLSLAVAIWIVCKTSRQNGVRMPIPTKTANVTCCCCCCCCCSRNTKSIAVQIITLWNILIFVQAIVTSTIPLFFLIILHPAKTLSILSVTVSTFFFLVIIAAHLFSIGRSFVWKSCSNALVTLLLSGIVIIFIVVYIGCLNYGVQTKGISGFLVSLLPSACLSVIGWFIKRKFLKQAEINDAETGLPTEHTLLLQQEN